MFKVEKRYNIQYAYAGIRQYFDVYEDKDGNMSPVRFCPSYAKIKDVPSVEHCKTVYDVLDVVNGFCNNTAKINLINGQLPFYYEDSKTKEYVNGLASDLDKYIDSLCNKFFSTIVIPILIKNDFKISTSHIGYPILIKKYDNEYDNIRDKEDLELEYICYKFTSSLNIYRGEKPKFTPEHGSGLCLQGVMSLLVHIDEELIITNNLRIES